MGLLKTALSLGGAAVGAAVGGPAGAKIGAALGGAAGGALSSSGGSKKATAAQLAALKEAQGKIDTSYADAKGYQQPYANFGTANMNALSGRLGLSPAPTAAPTTNALTGAPMGTQPLATAPTAQPMQQPDAPTGQLQPSATVAPTQPAPAADPAMGAPVQAQSGVDPGTYGSTANPQEPGAFSYGEADYKESPALKAALARASDVVQSSAAAGGSLFSGATQKELSDRAYQIALGDFNQERQFNYGLNRDQRSDYQDNRGYLTSRFDNQTDNLFRGTSVGQTAANNLTGAATNYGATTAGLVTEGGQVKAQNALTQGQIGSDLATGVGGLIAGAIGGGGTVARNAAQPVASDLGTVNYGNSLRMTSPYRF